MSINIFVQEIALIYGILPFVGLLSKPVVGIIADKLNAHRLVLLIALIVQGIFTFIVYFLPPMPNGPVHAETSVHLTCNEKGAMLDLYGLNASAIFCDSKAATEVWCRFQDAEYVFNALNAPRAAMPLHFSLQAGDNISSSSKCFLVFFIH